jgi:hypothetical protein
LYIQYTVVLFKFLCFYLKLSWSWQNLSVAVKTLFKFSFYPNIKGAVDFSRCVPMFVSAKIISGDLVSGSPIKYKLWLNWAKLENFMTWCVHVYWFKLMFGVGFHLYEAWLILAKLIPSHSSTMPGWVSLNFVKQLSIS